MVSKKGLIIIIIIAMAIALLVILSKHGYLNGVKETLSTMSKGISTSSTSENIGKSGGGIIR